MLAPIITVQAWRIDMTFCSASPIVTKFTTEEDCTDRAGQRADETILRGLTQSAAEAFAPELRHLAGEVPEAMQVEHDRRDGGEEEVHGC
jgi:hypothetical protein